MLSSISLLVGNCPLTSSSHLILLEPFSHTGSFLANSSLFPLRLKNMQQSVTTQNSELISADVSPDNQEQSQYNDRHEINCQYTPDH